jgi:hypothetical protein
MKAGILFFIASIFFLEVRAQHEGHQMEGMEMESDSVMAPMTNAFSLNLLMNRNGSGTGWLPDAAPMYGYMAHTPKWMFMFHGNVFFRYNNQDITNKGSRGDEEFDVPNWFMGMGQRRVGQRGLFRFSLMLSFDEVLGGGDGYPLLFQSGETYQGALLVDRQHPHDLVSELSVGYSHMITEDIDVFGYVGFPGEPALGPVAFMHRPSALNNPDAGLGHHWQDASHILFGVGTLGLRYKIFKLEGSIFTGREPDEDRYNFDTPRFDSYSYRLSVNLGANWALQASQAYLTSPEVLSPEEDVFRTTASVIHALPLGGENFNLNSAVIWGLNRHDGENEHSFLLESNLQLDRFALYGRYEWVQKSAAELALEGFDEHDSFNINALTLGTNYTVLRQLSTNFALGVQGSLFAAEQALDPVYGNNSLSAEVYLRISPRLMQMAMPRMDMKNRDHMQH